MTRLENKRRHLGAELITGETVGKKIEAIFNHWDEHQANYDIAIMKAVRRSYKNYKGVTPKQYKLINDTIEYHDIDIEKYGAKNDDDQ